MSIYCKSFRKTFELYKNVYVLYLKKDKDDVKFLFEFNTILDILELEFMCLPVREIYKWSELQHHFEQRVIECIYQWDDNGLFVSLPTLYFLIAKSPSFCKYWFSCWISDIVNNPAKELSYEEDIAFRPEKLSHGQDSYSYNVKKLRRY